MTLGAGDRRLFGFILFIEGLVAALAVFMNGFGVVFHFYFLLFGPIRL